MRTMDFIKELIFDIKYCVDTRGLIKSSKMNSTHTDLIFAKRYQSLRSSTFQDIQRTHPELFKNKVFLDVGSGKGKACILAMMAGVKKVYAVEICQNLHVISQKNLQQISKKYKSEFFHINNSILDIALPDDLDIIFLYNPFDTALLTKFLKKIKNEIPDRDYTIISVNTIRDYVYQLQGYQQVYLSNHSDNNFQYALYKSMQHS